MIDKIDETEERDGQEDEEEKNVDMEQEDDYGTLEVDLPGPLGGVKYYGAASSDMSYAYSSRTKKSQKSKVYPRKASLVASPMKSSKGVSNLRVTRATAPNKDLGGSQ